MNAPEVIPAAVLLPIDSIIRSPTNPRKHFNEEALKDLAMSIREHGVLQPILVRKWQVGMHLPHGKVFGDMAGVHEIVCGERRFRASQIACRDTIMGIVRELTDLQVLEIQVVENLQREDVHPIEEAEGYERLMKHHGYTADTLAEKIGKSRAYVYARLKLTALSPATREFFFDGKLTASTALLIARIPGAALQAKAAADITKPNWQGDIPSYRAAVSLIQDNYTLGLDDATFKPDDAKLVPEAGSCSTCLKRSGNDLVLFADIENPNVCTDPPCFNNKRQVNFLRLREIAEKSGKEVVTGEAALKMLVSGNYSLRQHNLESLDTKCYDDDQQRTYREILGKSPQSITLVEDVREKNYIEAIDTTVLAAALKKAGIGPKTTKGTFTNRAPTQSDWPALQAARAANTEVENTWRAKLFQAVRIKVGARFAESNVLASEDLVLVTVGLFETFVHAECNGIENLLELWQHPSKPDVDEDEEIAEFCKFLITLTTPELCLFLTDMTLIDEVHVSEHAIDNAPPPARLLAQATRLGIDAEALREPPPKAPKVQPKTAKAKTTPADKTAATPTEAAQAHGIGAGEKTTAAPASAKSAKPAAKKTKAKNTPAPALPANEPAAPVKPSTLNPVKAWPFPTGART